MSTESPASDALGGVQIVFQLPYHVDESIDFDTLGLEIDHVFAAGADGLVMAMVTEVLRLTEAERHEVAGFTCQAAAGRGPVVVSVGAESTRRSPSGRPSIQTSSFARPRMRRPR